jgi:GTP-binding protein HflX
MRRRKAEVPTVALIGYTNAGKSTLLNRLSGAGVYVADQLFATLDPTTRRVGLGAGRQALMTDTVGFIQKLPTTLVAAFRATLEEIGEADLLLHVVDVTHPNAREQAKAVLLTLNEIEIEGIPIITALNKIDALRDSYLLTEFLDELDRAVPISARTGEGIPSLLASIERELFDTLTPVHLKLPPQQGRLANVISRWGVVDRIEHTRQGILIDGQVPNRLLSEIRPFQISSDDELAEPEEELSDALADLSPAVDDPEAGEPSV